MARYLITGGAGFIGAHLAERLVADGHQLHILDNLSTGSSRYIPKGAKLFIGDIATPEEVSAAMDGTDGVFHLAAQASVEKSMKEPFNTHLTNLSGTVAVLEAALKNKLPVVYASSAAIYGDNPETPFVESAIAAPQSPYAADKYGCEIHAAAFKRANDLPTLGLRFFNVYGPRQDPRSSYSGVISLFADRLNRNEPIAIHGDGSQTRDFIFVGDIVNGLARSMALLEEKKTDAPDVLNLSTGEATSIVALAETMTDIWGKQVPLEHGDARAADVKNSVGNADAAKDALGFSGWVSLKDGLKELYDAQTC